MLVTPTAQILPGSPRRIKSVRPEPLINIFNTNLSPAQDNLKRLADIGVSALALLALSPLLAAVAAAVKMTSPGPAFPPPGAHRQKPQALQNYKIPHHAHRRRSHGPVPVVGKRLARVTPYWPLAAHKYRIDRAATVLECPHRRHRPRWSASGTRLLHFQDSRAATGICAVAPGTSRNHILGHGEIRLCLHCGPDD